MATCQVTTTAELECGELLTCVYIYTIRPATWDTPPEMDVGEPVYFIGNQPLYPGDLKEGEYGATEEVSDLMDKLYEDFTTYPRTEIELGANHE